MKTPTQEDIFKKIEPNETLKKAAQKYKKDKKMKTAMDYLLAYCERENWSIPNNIIEQAKEMEKDQIINAWIDDRFPLDKEWVKQCADNHYNETYGGNK